MLHYTIICKLSAKRAPSPSQLTIWIKMTQNRPKRVAIKG